MAEAAISFVIERMGDMLIQKVIFLKGVRGEVERLRNELQRMLCFLKDADQKQDEDERIRNWVSEIRRAAYDSEDAIEIFVLKIESRRKFKDGFSKKLYACFPKNFYHLYLVGKEIESIQARIQDIDVSRERYGIRNLGEGSDARSRNLRQVRRSSPLGEEKDIVGFKEETDLLVSRLLMKEERLSVVAVVGMGGIGKSTLARKVYKHAEITAQFSRRAWICVSEDCKPREIMKELILQFLEPDEDKLKVLEMMEKVDDPHLEEMLHGRLQDKRYLIVLDDIWQETAWDSLARAFPDGGMASRLLLTSRNEGVPKYADARCFPLMLKTLGPELSWELFVMKACVDNVDNLSLDELEDIGRKILQKCDGLPLAITVVGGLLSRKKQMRSEWEKVLKNIDVHLSRSQSKVSSILALSYNDLPPHLKSCVLYFGFFPEDFEIRRSKLVDLWICEGLIQNEEGETLEGRAENYLDELISRNMVQVVDMGMDERVKTCRVHDLLHELLIRKAKEEIYFEIIHDEESQPSNKSRHLVISCDSKRCSNSGYATPHLRSLFIHGLAPAGWRGLRLLRVLDMENVALECLPDAVGELISLRYLGLRNTNIKKLPSSFGSLWNLQVLDLTSNSPVEVPNVIWKVQNLRHLYLHQVQCNVPLRIDTLKKLQTLGRIHVNKLMLKDCAELISLRKLSLVLATDSDVTKLFASMANLVNLCTLSLEVKGTFPSLDGLSNLCHLTKLKLRGKIATLPLSSYFPPNLSYLTLMQSRLDEDPMPILEELPKLSFLKIFDAYNGSEMTITQNGFRHLKGLDLQYLSNLEKIKVGLGGMPWLKSLQITQSYLLQNLPQELLFNTNLQKLKIEANEELASKLQGDINLCSIPSVCIEVVSHSTCAESYLLDVAIRMVSDSLCLNQSE